MTFSLFFDIINKKGVKSIVNQKKFVDAEGLKHFAQVLNNYPDNEIIGTVVEAIGEELEGKVLGPTESTAGHIATFTGTTGKVI